MASTPIAIHSETKSGLAPATPSHTFQFHPQPVQTSKVAIDPASTAQLVAIKKDLAKTVILSIIAVSVELLLWAKSIVQ